MAVLSDVFTVEEIARAAGVPRETVDAVVRSGAVRPLSGTAFFESDEAIRAGIEARRVIHASAAGLREAPGIFEPGERTSFAARRGSFPGLASTIVHGLFVVTMLWLTSGSSETAPVEREESRLVFLARPGPGGGGGGGGLLNPLPPRPAETPSRFKRPRPSPDASPDKALVKARPVELTPPPPAPAPVPAPVVENPLPSRRVVAPVVPTTSGQHEGVALQAHNNSDSAGPGRDGGAGSGRGAGDGEGTGAGIGPGSGGGFGGGPYRAGSGVEPPRLLREVKAQYTDDARRRGIVGNVLLEIVVNRDGTVGEVSIRRGLGAGLDQRAIEAVRQWKFAPARRLGTPVDVYVEVAVEFMLR